MLSLLLTKKKEENSKSTHPRVPLLSDQLFSDGLSLSLNLPKLTLRSSVLKNLR